MSIRRIAVLLSKEFKYSTKSYFFIFAVVAPFILTLLVNLVFSSLFFGKPKLGVYTANTSQLVESLKDVDSIHFKEYASEIELKNAVASGACDVGLFLKENFESELKNEELAELTTYIWGESLLKDSITTFKISSTT